MSLHARESEYYWHEYAEKQMTSYINDKWLITLYNRIVNCSYFMNQNTNRFTSNTMQNTKNTI